MSKDVLMHDSGNREAFSSGAVRDTACDKPRPDLYSPFAEERVGEWLRLGAVKYAERNWERGIPNSRCLASLRRHVMRYQQGDRSEDHLAAVIFNAMAIIHNQEMIARGVLPAELDDMPEYKPASDIPWKCNCSSENSHNLQVWLDIYNNSPISFENSHNSKLSADISHNSKMLAENSNNLQMLADISQMFPLSAENSHNPPLSADNSHMSRLSAENGHNPQISADNLENVS